MKKFVWQIVGYCLLVPGLIILPSPIPIGLIMVALALAILLTTSKTVARLVFRLRYRFDRVDDKLTQAERHLPRSLRVPLARTRARRHLRRPIEPVGPQAQQAD